ncbi:hypothetical protein SUGI_1164640 [Cryptomeria japonica]|nr:hypothetical protein SUGI_1164640 [Cryptomeria japonica]
MLLHQLKKLERTWRIVLYQVGLQHVSIRFLVLNQRIGGMERVPEIIAVPITEGSEDYMQWMKENTAVLNG